MITEENLEKKIKTQIDGFKENTNFLELMTMLAKVFAFNPALLILVGFLKTNPDNFKFKEFVECQRNREIISIIYASIVICYCYLSLIVGSLKQNLFAEKVKMG